MRPWRTQRAVIGAALLLAIACAEPPTVERVVLVSIDTLRADYVGRDFGGRTPTPTLDALARRGVSFDAAIAPTPLTLPSHSSLMTGLNPYNHGVRNNGTFRLGPHVPTLAETMRGAGFATAAFVAAIVLDRQYGLDRGFDHYGDQMTTRLNAGPDSIAELPADLVVDAALEWLADAPDRFMIWLHLYDPHANHDPPTGFRLAFPGDRYAGEIAFADSQVARLLTTIDERWPDDRTLVVVTSDHGESLGEHAEPTHAFTIYGATQRVPLILHGPGVPEGRRSSAAVRLVDVAPTILSLAGVPEMGEIDGIDLRPWLDGSDRDPPPAYIETLAPQTDLGWSPLLGLRTSDRKYIRAPRPELYDLTSDPRETEDLAALRPAEVEELDETLARLLADASGAAWAPAPDPAARTALAELGYLVPGEIDPPDELGEVGGIDPKDGLPWIRSLTAAMAQRDAGNAEAALDTLAAIEGDGFVVESLRAAAALDAGDLDTALRAARRSVEAAPDSPTSHLALARILLARGQLAESEAVFRMIATLDRADPAPVVGLGRVAEARAEPERAEALYLEASQRRGDPSEALWRLAALRIERGAGADDLLARLDSARLASPRVALRLARAANRAGRYEDAVGFLDAALARNPQAPGLRAERETLGASR